MGVVACILVPLPPFVLDILLVFNLIFALSLLILALSIPEPLRLSSLPSLLLLSTLYRLALNICTTRLILSSGNPGLTVEAFGTFVIKGNIAVGIVIFLIITIVQFLVVAKGAERVAEVSARFSLDALPGRQMAIDADVRAGVCDFETARQKRQELQTESRFYGALDGAMKFVKGDALAGIVIIIINSLGGLVCGLVFHNLDPRAAVLKYSVLTIGDGLISQIPSLLNSIAAGLVVTRVARGDEISLAEEVLSQLRQLKRVQVIPGIVGLLAAFAPGLPFWPFIATGCLLCISGGFSGPAPGARAGGKQEYRFRPKVPALLRVEVDKDLITKLPSPVEIERRLENFRQELFERYGLLLLPPEFAQANRDGLSFRIAIRGVKAGGPFEIQEGEDVIEKILNALRMLVSARVEELIDDIGTRRLLDYFDSDFPELISNVVPSIVSVTRLTELLKKLAAENVPFRNLDMILQAVGESASKVNNERLMLEEVRVGLRRIICAPFMEETAVVSAYTLDPLIDLSFARAETERTPVNVDHVGLIASVLQHAASEGPPTLVVSKRARLLLRECLVLHGCNANVLAFEELVPDLRLNVTEVIRIIDGESDAGVFEALAA